MLVVGLQIHTVISNSDDQNHLGSGFACHAGFVWSRSRGEASVIELLELVRDDTTFDRFKGVNLPRCGYLYFSTVHMP